MTSHKKTARNTFFFKKNADDRAAFANSPGVIVATAVLVSCLSLGQPAWAECVSTGNGILCSGNTYAKDVPLAYTVKGGTSIVNEGDAFADGPKGAGLVGIGDQIEITNKGTVQTVGNAAHGLQVRGNDGKLVNNGQVTIQGVSPDALHAKGDRNVLVNNGQIRSGAAGDFVGGLSALGNNNRLINSNTILIEGHASSGLRAFGNGNTLTNSGTITATGARDTGMGIWGTGNTLLNTGTITATGKEAAGILSARIGEGRGDFSNSNIFINRGTIRVSGEGAHGVRVDRAGRITIVNDVTGVIESRSGFAIKLDDNALSAGNDRVENAGRLSNLSGGAAVDLGVGNDTFIIGSTSQIDGAIEAGEGRDTFVLGGNTDGVFDLSRSELRDFEVHEKVGASTWTIAGSSDRVMSWDIREGELMVTGSMGGSAMNVHSGAVLGGTGTVGSIDARTGSILSPGVKGIGSLAVTGNVLIAGGTTYRIDLGLDLKSDRIVAQGAATVQDGSSVQVNALPGDYKPGSRWTILTARNGVTGQFSSATTNLAFFKPVLTKDGQNIYLELERRNRPLPDGRPAPEPFDPVTEPELPDVLDQTSGSPIVSATGTILAHDDLFRAAVLCRLRCSTGGVPSLTTFDSALADYAADMPVHKDAMPVAAAVPRSNSDWAVWGKAIASWGSTDATAVSHAVERTTGGLVAGADMGFGTPYRLGVAAGYFSSDVSVGSLGSSGNVESVHLGVYGSASFGALNLRGGVAYAHHEVDMTRSIRFTGFSGTNRSESSVDSLQVFGEIGYMIPLNDTMAIERFVGLAHVHVNGRGVFEEGSELAVAGEVHSFDTTYTTLGARFIATMPTSAGEITFKGLVGWRHAFGDAVPTATFSYVGDGRPFLISGTPIDKDSLIVEAGLNWAVSKDVTLSASYTGAIGARDQEHTLRAGLTVQF